MEEQDVSSKDSVPKLERKKSGYASFKGRDGPRELGSKEIPQVRNDISSVVFNSLLEIDSICKIRQNDIFALTLMVFVTFQVLYVM